MALVLADPPIRSLALMRFIGHTIKDVRSWRQLSIAFVAIGEVNDGGPAKLLLGHRTESEKIGPQLVLSCNRPAFPSNTSSDNL